MAKILFCEPVSLENLKPFQETKHEIFFPKEEVLGVHEFDRSALIQTIKDLRPDVLVVGLKFQLNKEILSAWPGIEAVLTRTSGLDHIDLDYCEEHGIEILSLRGEDLSDITSTAEWTFLNMGMLLRKTGHELNGKNLLIIGAGRIGNMMAGYAKAFKMNVKFEDNDGSTFGDLSEKLGWADIVSLHITADEENRNFMDSEKFSEMRPGSWFLNSSRDWLVDSEALKKAVHLAGSWSDFPEHQGGKGIESSIKTEKILISKLLQWLSK